MCVLPGKASEMVSNLRCPMIRGQDQMDAVDPHKAQLAVFPILQGEAIQRHIALLKQDDVPAGPITAYRSCADHSETC